MQAKWKAWIFVVYCWCKFATIFVPLGDFGGRKISGRSLLEKKICLAYNTNEACLSQSWFLNNFVAILLDTFPGLSIISHPMGGMYPLSLILLISFRIIEVIDIHNSIVPLNLLCVWNGVNLY